MTMKTKVARRWLLGARYAKQSSASAQQRATSNHPRKGILLLVVLSMLTLFLLIGTAFIVSANHYRQTNKTLAKLTETSNSSIDQRNLLNEVVNQLIRDTNNQNSAMRFHSLLRDMYGNDGILAEISASGWAAGGTNGGVTGGQMLELQVTNTTTSIGLPIPLRDASSNAIIPGTELSPLDNAYNGLVLTFLDGLARGQSTRITGYLPATASTPAAFRVVAPKKADGSSFVDSDFALLNSSRIAINGRPFNGTGMGYNPLAAVNTARLNVTERVLDGTGTPFQGSFIALMPNAAFFDSNQVSAATSGRYFSEQFGNLNPVQQQRLLDGIGMVGQGGTDESYDAVDYQNMALALIQPNAIETVLPDLTALDPDSLGRMVIPSFHRPALINYWRRQLQSSGGTRLENAPNLLRKVLLRPNWLDHPNFTGGNPDYEDALAVSSEEALRRMIYGPWDVDNDNDGIRDSQWIDFGAPVMEDSDGRLVKPLAAVLVVDMDGRLNVNAHGSEDIANPTPFGETLAGGVGSDNLPQGQGYGPAEISLAPLMPLPFDTSGLSDAQIRFRRWRWYTRFFEGAEAGASADAVDSSNDAVAIQPTTADRLRFLRRTPGKFGQRPGNRTTRPLPGVDNPRVFDLLAELKMQGVPTDSLGQIRRVGVDGNIGTPDDVIAGRGGYATLPDFRGRYALGLNDLGQPVSEALVDTLNDSTRLDANTPYELDLSLGAARGDSSTAADGAYTVAEIERILRAYDPNAGELPSRLWDLAAEFRQKLPSPPAPPNTFTATPNVELLSLWRTALTTDSYDLPVPSVVVPEWMLVGPDRQPGIAGMDDDGNGTDDDRTEIGAAGSDDWQSVMGRAPVGVSFADLLEYRIRIAKSPIWQQSADTAGRIGQLRQEMRKLMPPDLANGLRLDINRPLGNGRDDNNNGVVDEPGEWDDVVTGNGNGQFDPGELEAPYWASVNGQIQNAGFTGPAGRFRDERILLEDRNNDRSIDEDDRNLIGISGNIAVASPPVINTHEELISIHNQRRQLLARDLYILAMTLVDPFDASTRQGSLRARQLAQWSINVVDYRDPDNIMTAFEYDTNPFDGWSPDGSLGTVADIYGADNVADTNLDYTNNMQNDQGGLVWGAERPELVMTETLSWHDRATEDRGVGFEDAVTDENSDGVLDGDDEGEVGALGSTGHDTDYDQRKRPRGATFIELYNPWPENPAENADLPRSNGGVNLSATVNNDDLVPIWRLQINKCGSAFLTRGGGPDRDHDDPEQNVRPQNPDRTVYFTNFDPESVNPNWDDNDGTAFFSSLVVPNDPTTHSVVQPGQHFVVGSGEQIGASQQYQAVIGDQPRTAAGSQRAIILDWSLGSVEPVKLVDDDGLPVMDSNGTPLDNSDDFRVVSPAADANSRNVAIIDMPRRFTVTEPANGYPDKVFNSWWRSGVEEYIPAIDIPLDNQRLVAEAGIVGGVGGDVIDGQAIPTADPRWFSGPGPGALSQMRKDDEGRLKLADKGSTVRTIPAFSWIYLQRLANPLQPWNPPRIRPNGETDLAHDPSLPVNPYMTIDSMGTNVTVFTGQATQEKRRQNGTIETYSNGDALYSFSSVQRGRRNDTDPEELTARLGETQDDFRQMLISTARTAGFLAAPHSTQPDVPHNLWGDERIGRVQGTAFPFGMWLNESGPAGDGLRREIGSATHFFNSVPDCTLGFINEPFRVNGGTSAIPGQPFPWMAWNNRPFANNGEIMHVPAFRSSQLSKTFSFLKTGTPPAGEPPRGDYVEQYAGNVRVGEYPEMIGFNQVHPALELDGPFGHLLNYFRTRPDDNSTPTDIADDRGTAGLNRLLDYVYVPSPFVGTETWLSPNNFGGGYATTVNDPRYQRQPPYNRISEYREPGRVNLNTVFSGQVWDGGLLHRELADQTLPYDPLARIPDPTDPTDSLANLGFNNYVVPFSHSGPLYVDDTNTNGFLETRRGYQGYNTLTSALDPVLDNSLLALGASYPTFFTNPFRSPGSASMVPLNNLHRPSTESTLLRRRAFNPGLDGQWGRAGNTDGTTNGIVDDLREFDPDGTDDIEDSEPLFASTASDEYGDARRNSYFRYQPITRLSSMTTNRSNVYAVWVTIGFFEVEEAPDLSVFQNANDPTGVLTSAQLQALYDRVYPEGFQFGREAGSETGNIRRVREFAMIDRTVPVAFEPGENHNIDKAVRLRRRID